MATMNSKGRSLLFFLVALTCPARISIAGAAPGGAACVASYQPGAESAPWQNAGIWLPGSRTNQNLVSSKSIRRTLARPSRERSHTQAGDRLVSQEILAPAQDELKQPRSTRTAGTSQVERARPKPTEPVKEPEAAPGIQPTVLDGVKVSVGFVGAWAGGNESGPMIEIKFNSPELADAKGRRAFVKEARDEEGKLLPENKPVYSGLFIEFSEFFQSKLRTGEFPQSFSLIARKKPKSIKQMTGTIEVVLPAKDAKSVITASFTKDAGAPLQSGALKEAGVEITLVKQSDAPSFTRINGAWVRPSDAPAHSGNNGVTDNEMWELTYKLKDPSRRLCLVEFLDARDGKVLVQRRPYSLGGQDHFAKTREERQSLGIKPPPEVIAKFYLLTDKSVVAVPFDLRDIQVP
jgi:hypothetical protein